MDRAKKFTLMDGVGVSLLLHACVALPIILWMVHTPHQYRHITNRLNVEVFGMLANRQTAAQQKRVESVKPSESAAPKHEMPDAKLEPIHKEIASTAPSLQQSEPLTNETNAVRLPQTASTQSDSSRSSGLQSHTGGAVQQQQQTIAVHNDMNDRIAAYMAQLTKRLQTNLIYPQEVKKKKIEGSSRVSFVIMESGEIRSNTLAVKKSSGNANLDAAALRTVASSAPFQKPPREISVSVELAFEVDRHVF